MLVDVMWCDVYATCTYLYLSILFSAVCYVWKLPYLSYTHFDQKTIVWKKKRKKHKKKRKNYSSDQLHIHNIFLFILFIAAIILPKPRLYISAFGCLRRRRSTSSNLLFIIFFLFFKPFSVVFVEFSGQFSFQEDSKKKEKKQIQIRVSECEWNSVI